MSTSNNPWVQRTKDAIKRALRLKYSSTLKKGAEVFSEAVVSTRLHGITSHNTIIFIMIARFRVSVAK